MYLAPSEKNIDTLRTISRELTQTKDRAYQSASVFIAKVSSCLHELTQGDADSLMKIAMNVAKDNNLLMSLTLSLAKEVNDWADDMEQQMHTSFTESVEETSGTSGTYSDENICSNKVQSDENTLQAIKEALKEINPNYIKHRFYRENCGTCAYALWLRLTGKMPSAKAGTTNRAPRNKDMEQLTGLTCKYMSPQEIAHILTDRGPGSHLIVGIDRKNGPGHWFNVYYDGDKIYTLDGQNGMMYDWPHDYGDIIKWCAMI